MGVQVADSGQRDRSARHPGEVNREGVLYPVRPHIHISTDSRTGMLGASLSLGKGH